MKLYDNLTISEVEQSLTYSDIGLVPVEVSELEHRSEADTNSEFLDLELKLPVISSPMESVTGLKMAQVLGLNGALGIVNRFDNSLSELEDKWLSKEYDTTVNSVYAVSLGLTDSLDTYKFWLEAFDPIICIDTANAQNRNVLKKVEEVKYNFPQARLIVGNIAYCSDDYYENSNILVDLNNLGVDAVRVGVGNGSACSTSVKTGVGIGQVTSVASCYKVKTELNLPIKLIADGGISTSGEIAKALALGADAVMLGRMFAGTKESPGNVIKYDGKLFKVYRGSASFGVKQNGKYIEGEETLVPYKGSVVDVLQEISDGLQSAMAYLNARTLDEFREKARFAILSNSAYFERLSKG